ncbi:hypothetical protein ACQPZK_20625 [Micromonospora sp. CA-249363]|uniref:hypothetical protein n=1 Tax=Micromonospora sp. CA-249363 TaxID=3239963 RepID=UPI003D89C8B4
MTVAACGGGGPVAKPAATPSTTDILDFAGRNGCENLAIAAREGATDDQMYLSAAQMAGSRDLDLATPGRALQTAVITVRGNHDKARDAELRTEMAKAKQAALEACAALLGD